MIKRIKLDNGTSLVIEARATGKVRMAFEHEHHTVTREDMQPYKLFEVEEAIQAVLRALAGSGS